jgi:DNA-binding CsgD family transcriptional regulator
VAAARRWGTPGAIGQALRTSGLIEDGERGDTLLRDALEQLEHSPARLEHANTLVDYGGARRPRRRPRPLRRALTPSGRRIAEHAAAGVTNPEIAEALFITVKTVEMHLGNAYRRLDITSRHELARHLRAAAPDWRQRLARPREGLPLVTKSDRAGGQARDTRTGRQAVVSAVAALAPAFRQERACPRT